jgi:hypothetical protein
LLFGYLVASTVLGLAVGFIGVHALYPEVAGWRGPVASGASSVALIALCWFAIPAHRPNIGALILRVAMVALLPIGVFAARQLVSARGSAVGREAVILTLATAAFGIALWVARRTRWGQKWTT